MVSKYFIRPKTITARKIIYCKRLTHLKKFRKTMLQAFFFQIYFVNLEPVAADWIALSKPTFVKFMLRVDHYMAFEEANLNLKKTL